MVQTLQLFSSLKLSLTPSIYQSIYLSIYLPICLSIYVYLSISLCRLPVRLSFWACTSCSVPVAEEVDPGFSISSRHHQQLHPLPPPPPQLRLLQRLPPSLPLPPPAVTVLLRCINCWPLLPPQLATDPPTQSLAMPFCCSCSPPAAAAALTYINSCWPPVELWVSRSSCLARHRRRPLQRLSHVITAAFTSY